MQALADWTPVAFDSILWANSPKCWGKPYWLTVPRRVFLVKPAFQEESFVMLAYFCVTLEGWKISVKSLSGEAVSRLGLENLSEC
jgi:hypothetical protein